MEKWEYKIVKFGVFSTFEKRQEELSDLGEQGWELVNIDQHGYTWVFKRKKNRYQLKVKSRPDLRIAL